MAPINLEFCWIEMTQFLTSILRLEVFQKKKSLAFLRQDFSQPFKCHTFGTTNLWTGTLMGTWPLKRLYGVKKAVRPNGWKQQIFHYIIAMKLISNIFQIRPKFKNKKASFMQKYKNTYALMNQKKYNFRVA